MHTAHCTLYIVNLTLHTAYYTLKTAHCTLHTAGFQAATMEQTCIWAFFRAAKTSQPDKMRNIGRSWMQTVAKGGTSPRFGTFIPDPLILLMFVKNCHISFLKCSCNATKKREQVRLLPNNLTVLLICIPRISMSSNFCHSRAEPADNQS